MNLDQQKSLEAEIGRELKRLPELAAPATLVNRAMAAVEKGAAVPWYRQPWFNWPVLCQAVSLLLLAGLCAGLSFGCHEWLQHRSTLAYERAQLWVSGADVVWNTARVLVSALVLVVQKLGLGFMIASCTVAVFSYLACVGLGTVAWRFAFAKRG
jgi:hypothetical protein